MQGVRGGPSEAYEGTLSECPTRATQQPARRTPRRGARGEGRMEVREGMAQAVLRPTVLSRLGEIETADLVVGIPSFNNANSIAHVVRAVSAGLSKYFPDARS